MALSRRCNQQSRAFAPGCSFLGLFFALEDGDSTFLGNVSELQKDDMTSQPRK
jgi:hypothetical protein